MNRQNCLQFPSFTYNRAPLFFSNSQSNYQQVCFTQQEPSIQSFCQPLTNDNKTVFPNFAQPVLSENDKILLKIREINQKAIQEKQNQILIKEEDNNKQSFPCFLQINSKNSNSQNIKNEDVYSNTIKASDVLFNHEESTQSESVHKLSKQIQPSQEISIDSNNSNYSLNSKRNFSQLNQYIEQIQTLSFKQDKENTNNQQEQIGVQTRKLKKYEEKQNKSISKFLLSDETESIEKSNQDITSQNGKKQICINSKNQIVYQCQKCDYSSTYLQNYKRHFIKSHPNTDIICQTCQIKFSNKQELISHEQEKHNLEYLNCEDCDYKTKHSKLLQRHIVANHSKIMLKCQFQNCKFQTNIQRYMQQHKEYSHSTTTLSCNKCSFQTTNPQSMYQHKRHMHTNQIFSCGLCEFKTTNEKNINIHKKHMHTNITFQCKQCEFQSKNKDYLKRHMKKYAPQCFFR